MHGVSSNTMEKFLWATLWISHGRATWLLGESASHENFMREKEIVFVEIWTHVH